MAAVGETYVRAILHAGGTPVIIPPMLQEQDWAGLFASLDALLLSGGADIAPVAYGQEPESWLGHVDEERDRSELGLTRLWLKSGKPILAICRGHQLLNVALGGTLYQDISAYYEHALDHAYTPARPMENDVHAVTLDQDSRLANILGVTELPVNSAHHQAIRDAGAGLSITAHAPDGVIEAAELPDHPFCISVQWHPEAMVKKSDSMRPLFDAFVQAARL